MPTYRVDELRGALLDAAVAKALGAYLPAYTFGPPPYSCNWVLAGPIIERERIGLTFIPATEGRDDLPAFWAAEVSIAHADPRPRMASGCTPLEAAMRLFVRAKLGEEIEL